MLRIHYLEAILNPLFDYSQDNFKIRIGTRVSEVQVEEEYKSNSLYARVQPEDAAFARMTDDGVNQKDQINSKYHSSLGKGRKPLYRPVNLNQSLDDSLRTIESLKNKSPTLASLKHFHSTIGGKNLKSPAKT